jgi:lysophospholipase L1-like esterase
MRTFRRNSGHFFIAILGMLLLSGCEDSGGGSGSSEKDFGDNNPAVCVAYGDSITYGTGLGGSQSYPAQLAGMIGKTVINSGSPGRSSSQGASGVSTTLSRHKPGYLLILFGANDLIKGGRSTDGIVANLRAIVQAAKNNKTVPIIATLTPVYGTHDFISGGVDELNQKIRQMAKEEGARVAKLNDAFGTDPGLLQRDGLHPTVGGAGKMAEVFGGVIQ